ncbi:TPA: hypothetical protein ACIJOP_003705, partial [Escherichia coli]
KQVNSHNKIFNAQCFPRLARPLHVAVLMQLHRYYGSAPALTASSWNGHPRRMQKHSLVACTAYLMTNQLKRHRSSHKKNVTP